jgi:hypothetical protein
VGSFRTLLRYLGAVLVITLVALVIAIAFVAAVQGVSVLAGLLVMALLITPAAHVIAWPVRRWHLPMFASDAPTTPEGWVNARRGEMGRTLFVLGVLTAVAAVAWQAFGSLSGFLIVGVLSIVTLPPAYATWLSEYRRRDLRVLLRRDAWLHPRRLREELRSRGA